MAAPKNEHEFQEIVRNFCKKNVNELKKNKKYVGQKIKVEKARLITSFMPWWEMKITRPEIGMEMV